MTKYVIRRLVQAIPVLIGNYKETYASDEAIFRTPATRAWMGVAAVAALLFPLVAGDYLLYLANLMLVLALGDAARVADICPNVGNLARGQQ